MKPFLELCVNGKNELQHGCLISEPPASNPCFVLRIKADEIEKIA